MKIFLPIHPKKTGGTSTFARKFKKELKQRGHNVFINYETNYDILLASPRCPLKYLIEAKRKGKPIIHRLDGVYYPATTAGWLYPFHNIRLGLIRNYFANYIIYQSNYSKYVCDRFLSTYRPRYKIRDTIYEIIYNGVDTDLFSSDGEKQKLRDSVGQHIFITASRFRRKDQIIPLLQALERYVKIYEANSKLIIIGDFGGVVASIPRTHRRNKQVRFTGSVPNEQLPLYLRAADIFLFTHQNPPCPNNVIEAMACGLPICGVADGAMTELTSPGYNSELIPVTDDAFYRWRTLDTVAFANNMHTIMEDRKTYARHSRNVAIERFQLEDMINKYLSVIEKMIS